MSEVKTFRALYNFEAQEDDELDMQAGDLIDVYVVHEGSLLALFQREQKHSEMLAQKAAAFAFVSPTALTPQHCE